MQRYAVRMRRAVRAVVVAMACLTACSDGGGAAEARPDATLPPGSSSTTSTTAERTDPFAIPDDPADIDEAYLQRVVDALYAVDAMATRKIVASRALSDAETRFLRAIFLEEEYDQQVDGWQQTLARGPGMFRDPPGALAHDVTRLITVAPDCIYLEALRDFGAVTARDVEVSAVYLGLTPKRSPDDPGGLNPTPWMLFSDGFNLDGSVPEDPCAGQ
jgi:hypothetical protein